MYPAGLPDEYGPNWNLHYDFQNSTVDDIKFVRTVKDMLVEDLQLDESSIFATGMSNGADMTYYVACQPDTWIRAIAPVAGTMLLKWECNQSGKGISVMHTHGTLDQTTPMAGDIDNKKNWGAYYGTEQVLKFWSEWSDLLIATRTPIKRAWPGKTYKIDEFQWTSEATDTEVRLYKFYMMGHDWPANIGTTEDISLGEQIWQFFTSKRQSAATASPRNL